MFGYRKIKIIFFVSLILLNILSVGIAQEIKEINSIELDSGKIDDIKSNSKIIINDILFTINDKTKFLSSEGHLTTLKAFCTGDNVLFHGSRELVLNVIQLDEKGSSCAGQERENDFSERDNENTDKIHFVNGVWKN